MEHWWATLDQTEVENRAAQALRDLTHHRNEQFLLINLGTLSELQVVHWCQAQWSVLGMGLGWKHRNWRGEMLQR